MNFQEDLNVENAAEIADSLDSIANQETKPSPKDVNDILTVLTSVGGKLPTSNTAEFNDLVSST